MSSPLPPPPLSRSITLSTPAGFFSTGTGAGTVTDFAVWDTTAGVRAPVYSARSGHRFQHGGQRRRAAATSVNQILNTSGYSGLVTQNAAATIISLKMTAGTTLEAARS